MLSFNRRETPSRETRSRETEIRQHPPLRRLLLTFFLVQTLGVASLVYYLSFRNGQQAIHKLVNQLQTRATERVEQHLTAFFEQPAAVVQTNATAVMLGQLDLKDHDAGRRFFRQQQRLFAHIDGLYWGTDQGEFLCVCGNITGEPVEKIVEQSPQRSLYSLDEVGNRLDLLDQDEYDPRVRPWYLPWRRSWYRTSPLGGQSHPTLHWSDIYTFTNGNLGITASSPIYERVPGPEGPEELALIGVAGADIRLDQINSFLKDVTTMVAPRSQLFIFDHLGKLIASSDAMDAQSPEVRTVVQALADEFDNLPSIAQSEQFSYRQADGSQQFMGVLPYKSAASLNWLIVVTVPESDFTGEIQRSTQATLRWCALAILVSVMTSMVIAHLLTAPIQRISKAALAISEGNLDQTVSGGGTREVQQLAQAFNSMARSLQQSFNDLETANATLEERVQQRTADLKQEKEKSERLLLNILPKKIADQLKLQQRPIAKSFDEVSILFADIVGFTPLSSKKSAVYVVDLLNQLFCEFDDLVELHQLEKIKTIGDAYMVAAGLPEEREDHADVIAAMALDMMAVLQRFVQQNQLDLAIRIGINSGAAVAGVIGHKKFIYDLWGDAVNVASRMESSGESNRIQVSESTYQLLEPLDYQFEKRGEVRVKGKGKMMTYWLLGEASEYRVRQKQLAPEFVVRALKSPEDAVLVHELSA